VWQARITPLQIKAGRLYHDCHEISSPGEFPMQRSREDGFSGLIFDL
jgi:hypothetical protein